MQNVRRHIALLATPNAQALEVTGPIEVFAMANRKLREAGRSGANTYDISLISAVEDLHIYSASGLRILAERCYSECQEPIDTLLIAGGLDLWSASDHPDLLEWIRKQEKQVRRIASVCTGAFVLAEAGLLEGKRVTTHWYFAQQLQERFPATIVDPEPIFIRSGKLATSAGVTAGLDLALALVEEDLGLDISLRVARALVLFLRRSEGENQFSTSLALQGTTRLPLREIPIYILEHLSDDLSVEALAARLSMSPRNFSRVFAEEFNRTPATFVEELRLDTARRLLNESEKSMDEIAANCGFGGADQLRRAFKRKFGYTPPALRAAR
jgi:transcriptional regulator GlxA family with amidase domain